MRSDMFELLLERPRKYRGCRGRHAPGYPRAKLRPRPLDEAPLCEGMGARYAERSLNENLAPLARWLRAQVRRPWTHVYAELSRGLSVDSAVKQHVRDHVADFVHLQVVEEGGVLLSATRTGLWPLVATRGRPPLYVCPRTGLLRELRPPGRVERDVRPLEDGRYLVRRRGVLWWVVVTAPIPTYGPERVGVCALTGLAIDSDRYRRACRAGQIPWPWDRAAVAAYVPSKARLRALMREAERVAIRARG